MKLKRGSIVPRIASGCALVLFVMIGANVAVPAPAAAGVLFNWERTTEKTFSGDGCGSNSTVRAYADKNARGVTVTEPEVGDTLTSEETDEEVASVTAISTSKDSNGRVWAVVTATGSGASCAVPEVDYYGDPIDPDYYEQDLSWSTGDVPIEVSFSRLEQVWFNEFYAEGSETRTRQRPRWIHGGSDFGWQKLHWYGWGKATATARGQYVHVEKWNGGSTVHRYPVRIRFDRPDACYERVRYKRMTTTFLGKRPPKGAGAPSRRVWRIGLTCGGGIY